MSLLLGAPKHLQLGAQYLQAAADTVTGLFWWHPSHLHWLCRRATDRQDASAQQGEASTHFTLCDGCS